MSKRIKKFLNEVARRDCVHRIAYGCLALAYAAQCLGADKLTISLIVTCVYGVLTVKG